MKVEFISTTNSLFEELIGKECELSIGLTANYKFDPEGCSFDFRHGYGRTSRIKQINYNEVSLNCYDIEIITNNSTYVFRHGTKTDKKPLTEEEKLNLQLALGAGLI